jgi:hypothetical protein
MNLALKISSIAALAGLLQWVAIYGWLEPWWRRGNEIGHSLVLLALLAAVFPALLILSLFWDLNRQTSEILAWVVVAELSGTCAAMIRRSFIWVRIARRENARQRGQG